MDNPTHRLIRISPQSTVLEYGPKNFHPATPFAIPIYVHLTIPLKRPPPMTQHLNSFYYLFRTLLLTACNNAPHTPTGQSPPVAKPPEALLGILRLNTDMHTVAINCIARDAKGQYLVTGSDDKTARVWSLPDGKLLRVLRPPRGEGNEGKISAVALSPDGNISETAWGVNIAGNGKVAVAALGDGTIRWYRLQDGKELVALFPYQDRKRWILWTPEGYYDASAGAANLIGWHINQGPDKEAKFIPLGEQQEKYHRPDLIMKVLDDIHLKCKEFLVKAFSPAARYAGREASERLHCA